MAIVRFTGLKLAQTICDDHFPMLGFLMEENMTVGLVEPQLAGKALEALRQQPNCTEIRSLDIYGLPDAPDGQRNWEIANVDCSQTWTGDIARGVITVHYQLGRKFHLMMDS